MMDIIAAARAWVDLIVLEEYIAQVSRTESIDRKVYAALSKLRSIFSLTTIIHPQSYNSISFVEDGYLSPSQLNDIKWCVDELLEKLLPDAIALTDAWDFTDASLCSAIGQYNGNAYETLMSWTRQLPINQKMNEKDSVCRESWEKWVKPALNINAGSPKAKL